MIKANDLVKKFENELNDLLPKGCNLAFKIWAEAGEHEQAKRQGNTVKYIIEGSLRTNTSAMEANPRLTLGVNGLNLMFMIPVSVPRTSMSQTEEELRTVQDGQYYFPAFVMDILAGYFQRPKAFELNGYAIGLMGGVSIPGDIDIRANYGRSIPVTVFLTANIMQGGTLSTDVTVAIDDNVIPTQVVTPSRVSVLNNDVLSGAFSSKGVATSSAFALQVQFPSNSFAATTEILSYLLHGDANKAYFIDVAWGNKSDNAKKTFFMIITRANGAAEGVTIAGFTAEFAEVVKFTELLAVPDNYQVGRFVFDYSTAREISFNLNIDKPIKAFVGGEVIALNNGNNTVKLSAQDFVDDDGKYYVYVITNRAMTINNAEVSFEVVKGAN